jgi:hypothetical protein
MKRFVDGIKIALSILFYRRDEKQRQRRIREREEANDRRRDSKREKNFFRLPWSICGTRARLRRRREPTARRLPTAASK